MPICPVCSGHDTLPLHDRLTMPVMMNQVYLTSQAAKQATRGIVHMHGCANCGFVWNATFDPKLVTYDENYENNQCHSPAFSAHVLARARDVIDCVPPGEKLDFLDVGCGQGTFIALVASEAGERLRSAQGFDPAWRGQDGTGPAGSRIHKCYFTDSSAYLCTRPPNVVTSRHTIEHVPDPVGFLRAIRQAMGAFGDGDVPRRIFVETPSIEWIVRQLAVQDFFYEHCSLFSARALALAMTRAGFHQPDVRTVFGDQYLWAQATTVAPTSAANQSTIPERQDFAPLIQARSRFVTEWRDRVAAAASTGRVALWGAGAKGVTFALLADPDQNRIDHVIDINPGKQGGYLGGSGLPVISPEEAAQRQAQTIFVMNPLYLDEIAETCRVLGLTAQREPIN